MPELEPITREEKFLNGEVGMTPITREEKILAGEDIETVTRREYFLKKYRGGGDITVEEITITENGTTTAPSGKAYSPIHTNVPQPTLTKLTATENGDYTASSGTAYNEVEVALPLDDKTITQNGTYLASDDNLEGYDEVNVNVPLPENAYLLKSVANLPQPIASFNDGEDMVMPTLKVAIEPQQEGSGDPSPTNVRPISGWDEENVTRTGKNLWDNKWADYTQPSDYRICPIKLKNGTYTASVKLKDGGTRQTGFTLGIAKQGDRYTNFGSFYTASTGDDKTGTITVGSSWTSPKLIIYCANESAFNAIFDNYEIQLEEGNQPTAYTPYNGHTYTIDLDGTRYGGTLDVISGVLTVDRVGVDLSSVSFTYDSSNKRWSRQFSDMKSYSARSAELMFEQYQATTSAYTGDTGTAFAYGKDIYIYDANQSLTISGKCVYELATPITYQLTPTQVKSLLGANNIWADTGDITDAEYFSKEV